MVPLGPHLLSSGYDTDGGRGARYLVSLLGFTSGAAGTNLLNTLWLLGVISDYGVNFSLFLELYFSEL